MRLTPKRIALSLLLIWVAWWAYEFFSAPVPDYEMRKVFALLMSIGVPCAGAAIFLLFTGLKAVLRRSR